eukprot:gene17331-23923_t
MPTKYYRTQDPLEYFKLRIVVREITKLKSFVDDESNSTNEKYNQDITLSWQQKLYSPSDISDYLQHKNGTKGGTVIQNECRKYLAGLEQRGGTAKDLIKNVMLYTYVDKDHFQPEQHHPIITESNNNESYLGVAVTSHGKLDKHAGKRHNKISQKIFNEKPFKSMHICLATEVETDYLQQGILDNPHDHASHHYSEHVLCSINVYQDGLIEVSPSFSGIVSEVNIDMNAHHTTPQKPLALSPFLDEKTTEIGRKKGFRLSTFKLRTKSGTDYEYIIQNLNEIIIPQKINEHMMKNVRPPSELSMRSVGNWNQSPSSKHKSIAIYAEIVSGYGFEGENIYVNYQIELPSIQGWTIRKNNRNDNSNNSNNNELIGKELQSTEFDNLLES